MCIDVTNESIRDLGLAIVKYYFPTVLTAVQGNLSALPNRIFDLKVNEMEGFHGLISI